MASIDRKQIATAALAIVDERGPKALTMRAVADALGVTAMALYHYVEDKTALVALLVDEAIGDRPLPSAHRRGVGRRTCSSSPAGCASGAQPPSRDRPPPPGAPGLDADGHVASASAGSGSWLQSGLPLEAAAEAAMTTLMAINGMVDQEAALPSFDVPDDEALAWFPNLRSRSPATAIATPPSRWWSARSSPVSTPTWLPTTPPPPDRERPKGRSSPGR